jgi:hypothetical protein
MEALIKDLEQWKGKFERGQAGEQVPGELCKRPEGSLRPAFLLIIVLVFLVRRIGQRIDRLGLNKRGSQRQQRRQSTELLKAATLLRLHELLNPRVAVTDLLLAQLRRHSIHRLSSLGGAGLSGAGAGGLPCDDRFGDAECSPKSRSLPEFPTGCGVNREKPYRLMRIFFLRVSCDKAW